MKLACENQNNQKLILLVTCEAGELPDEAGLADPDLAAQKHGRPRAHSLPHAH